jgi:U3 small nucleolar RNA-associated protein 25
VRHLQVKLFSEIYESDVVVASPLALATKLAENKADTVDILSSIEVLVMFRADVMLMQNWKHVETVLSALNLMPSAPHGTDIMRVRCERRSLPIQSTVRHSTVNARQLRSEA